MTKDEKQPATDSLPRILENDPYLQPYAHSVDRRIKQTQTTERRLIHPASNISDFASGHEYFGLHRRNNEWVFREWAPHATGMYIVGDMTGWQERKSFALEPVGENGVWEIHLAATALKHGDLYRLRVHWPNGQGDRIPAYARRVVQDHDTLIFNAQVWLPPDPYHWQCLDFEPVSDGLLVYEAHVGMAQEEEKIGSYAEFTQKILPRIVAAGYNTLQLMAIQEHPYYGSFGYQVSNFFAASSRFGTPEALKALIDTAHVHGIRVIMDLIHSHGVSNEVEGLSRFNGTRYQYFHDGPRGIHKAWDSRCFDYGKDQVLHFLLSNCRFWLDEYRFDGFRFDGVTSMLYLNHGLGKAFTTYDDYFDDNVDEDAYVYLTLANKLIHDIRPDAITIAEDVSGMPGLAVPYSSGGVGFDYRFAMGVPDNWIRLVKDTPDEEWHLGHLWYELTNRRSDEKTISYAESHDQALVGDQTLIFRLMGSDMYFSMNDDCQNIKIDRGIALHKIIRLITLSTAGSGYLNFMGNEFGHPEWIDFPRAGNNWSYRYARRQWSLADNPALKYRFLSRFDQDMIALVKRFRILASSEPHLLFEHSGDKVIVFRRASLLFVFNFHPGLSHVDYCFAAPPGKYRMIFNTDAPEYGGYNRLQPDQCHQTIGDAKKDRRRHLLSLYIPTRTGMVLQLEEQTDRPSSF